MKRLTTQDLNTPEHFANVFATYTDYKFDLARQVEFYRRITPQMRVLDCAAGIRGFVECYLHSGGKAGPTDLHALDFCPFARADVLRRQPLINYILGDVRAMPYRDDFFDFVGAGEIIEHMEEPAAFAAELARVTRPGGTILISTVDPDCETAIEKGRNYPEHLWQYTPEDLIAFFAPHGDPRYFRLGNYDMLECRVG